MRPNYRQELMSGRPKYDLHNLHKLGGCENLPTRCQNYALNFRSVAMIHGISAHVCTAYVSMPRTHFLTVVRTLACKKNTAPLRVMTA